MRDNNFINIIKEKERKGFTLIELLATIVIITLVFTIGFVFISDIFDSSNEAMDGINEKTILSVVEDYVLEFREEVTWNEGEDKEGNTGFCITLDSLINYGYFEGNEEEVNEYRETHFIKGIVKNGVYSYTLLEKGVNGSTISNECKFYKQDAQIVNNGSGNVPINEEEQKIGEFIYNVSQRDEKNYDTYVNFSIDFKLDENIIKIPTYVVVVLDRSGSMSSSSKFTNAKSAATSFSIGILEKVKDAQIALISYASDASVTRDFANANFKNVDFGSASGTTATDEAIDLALKRINEDVFKKNENANVYTLLLFDGVPDDTDALISSSKKLKNAGSKLIVVGYEMEDVSSNLKTIATADENFCTIKDENGNILNKGFISSSNVYCYYDSGTANISQLFSNISQSIIENVRSTDVQNASLILEAPIINGEKAFTIMKNNRIVDKIEEDIYLSGLEESVKLVINDTYQLRISDNFFKRCSENGECEIASLFNAKIILEYGGEIEDRIITIGEEQLPSFKITIDEINEVN